MVSMLKKFKRKIKEAVYNFIYFANFKHRLKNYILFESNPDCTDSPKAVFDKMIAMGINKKYKLVWIVKNKEKFKNIKINNVLFVQRDKKLINRIVSFYYIFNAKYIIDCNTCIKKINKRQKRIYLTHGFAMKEVRSYFEDIGKVDYITVPSKWSVPKTVDLFKVTEDKIAITGLPRNDCFFTIDKNEEKKIKENFGQDDYIVWLPTYRNHKNKKMDSTFNIKTDYSFCVPILNELTIKDFNEYLKGKNIHLYIKPHPAEKTDNIKKLKLSNILLIDDEILAKNDISLNQFLKYSIGLITDYSSVYYDYCVTLKPIGLSIADIEEYTKHVKLIFDSKDYKKEIKGEYIYNYDDLIKYVNKVKENLNSKRNHEEYDKYNDYKDSHSAERVIELLNLDFGESNEK